MSASTPIRILQVVGGMNRAGIETWLMHVLRNIDRNKFQMDFLVHSDRKFDYSDEIKALGSRVIPCLNPSKPWAYAQNFKKVIQHYGPYDIVHSHIHHYSGFVLQLANKAGIPVRISHSHSDTKDIQLQAGVGRRVYLRLMESWIKRYSTYGLAASKKAAVALFGSNWEQDFRWKIHYCAIDLEPFKERVNKDVIRKEFNISKESFIIGHVGRFTAVKNHNFIIEIAKEVVKQDSSIKFLLVGEGPLRTEIEKLVKVLGLQSNVIFTGVRSDIPRIMRGAMDAFLFPSLYEGLPVSLLEAQAAGLPCVFSDVITDEVDIIKPLIFRQSLKEPTAKWIDILMYCKKKDRRDNFAVPAIQVTPFNIDNCIKGLESLYLGNW